MIGKWYTDLITNNEITLLHEVVKVGYFGPEITCHEVKMYSKLIE